MKTGHILKIGSRAAVYTLLAGIIAKVGLTWYYGYRNINASYGGWYFYNWRAKYMDRKMTKYKYERNKLNEHPATHTFLRYYDAVEGETPQHALRRGPGGKIIYGDTRTEYPYYAYAFPDTYVLGPKNTWKIFEKSPKALDLELRVLQLRGKFLSKMGGLKFDLKNPYFKQPAKPGETAREAKARKEKMGKQIKPSEKAPKPTAERIRKFYSDPKNTSFIDMPAIMSLFKNVRDNPAEYSVALGNGKAAMSAKLSGELMPIVSQIFKGFSLTESAVNAYFLRLATITASPMDVHILHRFYLLMFSAFLYVDVSKVGNQEYNEAAKELKKLKAQKAAAAQQKVPFTKDQESKMKLFKKKTEGIKYEMILTRLSQVVGNMLGNRGIFREDGKDARGFFERRGSPGTSRKSSFKKNRGYKANTTLLNKEMDKILNPEVEGTAVESK